MTPLRVGNERIRRRKTVAASLRKGERIQHAGSSLRAPVAWIGAVGSEGDSAFRLQVRAASLTSRPTSQWPV